MDQSWVAAALSDAADVQVQGVLMRLLLLVLTLPSLWYAAARDGTPICHRVNGSGNTGNGYNLLVVSDRQLERHRGHPGDLIPAPNGFCLVLFPPTTTNPPTPTTRPSVPPTTRPPTPTTRPPTPTTRPPTVTTRPPGGTPTTRPPTPPTPTTRPPGGVTTTFPPPPPGTLPPSQ